MRWEDTMVAHFPYASHLPKGVGHIGSVYCSIRRWKHLAKAKDAGGKKGESPWDAIERATPEERETAVARLLGYNAADCVVTIRSWNRMQPDLESERHVYESDKRVLLMCQRMRQVGIGFDQVKQKELWHALRNRKRGLLGEMRRLL